MDAPKAIRLMIDSSGKSPSEIASSIGKSRSYVYTLRKQKSAPGVDTFARLLHDFGYKLLMERPDGEQLELYSEEDANDYCDEIGRGNPTRDDWERLYFQDPKVAYTTPAPPRSGEAKPFSAEEEEEFSRRMAELESDPDYLRFRDERKEKYEREKLARQKKEESFFDWEHENQDSSNSVDH